MEAIDEEELDSFLFNEQGLNLHEDQFPQSFSGDMDDEDVEYKSGYGLLMDKALTKATRWLNQWNWEHKPRMFFPYLNGDLMFVLSQRGGVVAICPPIEESDDIVFLPLEQVGMKWTIQGIKRKIHFQPIEVMEEEIICRRIILDFLEDLSDLSYENDSIQEPPIDSLLVS